MAWLKRLLRPCTHKNAMAIGESWTGRMGPRMQCPDCGTEWSDFIEGD